MSAVISFRFRSGASGQSSRGDPHPVLVTRRRSSALHASRGRPSPPRLPALSPSPAWARRLRRGAAGAPAICCAAPARAGWCCRHVERVLRRPRRAAAQVTADLCLSSCLACAWACAGSSGGRYPWRTSSLRILSPRSSSGSGAGFTVRSSSAAEITASEAHAPLEFLDRACSVLGVRGFGLGLGIGRRPQALEPLSTASCRSCSRPGGAGRPVSAGDPGRTRSPSAPSALRLLGQG